MSALPLSRLDPPATASAAAVPRLRLLLSVPEPHPTHRPDVAVLFGKYLPRLGIGSDLVGCHVGEAPPPWPGGERLTLRAPAHGIGRHLGSLRADLRLPWLARRGHAAVVVRDKTLGAALGLLAARLAGVPFIYWMSFPMVEAWARRAQAQGRSAGWLRWAAAWVRGHLLSRLLYGAILPRADRVFVQSDAMRDALVARGLRPDRLVPVPMGVDAEAPAFRDAPPAAAAAPASSAGSGDASVGPFPTFGYLGTLNRIRQPELMVQAFAIVHRTRPDARLLLVGDADNPQDREWLDGCIAAAGPAAAAIERTGWLPVDEGWRRIAGCVAGLSPIPRTPVFDVGSPTKLVEYFSLGLPVIANDQPDQAAVMAAVRGPCVPLTAEAFAAAMLDVLADPKAHRAVAARGRAYVLQARTYGALGAAVAGALREACPAPARRLQTLMLGPGLDCRGGIASVCATYARCGVFERLGIRYLSTFEHGSGARKLRAAASAALALARALVAGRVGLLHVHVATNASFWRKAVYCEMARAAGVPYLLHLHSGDMPAFVQRCGPAARRLVLRTLRGAARVLVLSTEWQAWLRTLDPALQAEVLPNPIEPPPAHPGQRSGVPTVLFLGRLEAAKGVPELIQAFAAVRRRLPAARLVLCGEGDRSAVDAQVRALGMREAVDCPGWVGGAAKQDLLSRAWVFALPSHREGVPIGMLEAMAAGLPAIGTPVGGVPGLLQASGGGLLVPVGDAPALADALGTLLSDAALRERMGRRAREHALSQHGIAAVERRLAALHAQARMQPAGA